MLTVLLVFYFLIYLFCIYILYDYLVLNEKTFGFLEMLQIKFCAERTKLCYKNFQNWTLQPLVAPVRHQKLHFLNKNCQAKHFSKIIRFKKLKILGKYANKKHVFFLPIFFEKKNSIFLEKKDVFFLWRSSKTIFVQTKLFFLRVYIFTDNPAATRWAQIRKSIYKFSDLRCWHYVKVSAYIEYYVLTKCLVFNSSYVFVLFFLN